MANNDDKVGTEGKEMHCVQNWSLGLVRSVRMREMHCYRKQCGSFIIIIQGTVAVPSTLSLPKSSGPLRASSGSLGGYCW